MPTDDEREAIRSELGRRKSALTCILFLSPILVVGMLVAFGPWLGLIWLVFVAVAVALAVRHYRRLVDAANVLMESDE